MNDGASYGIQFSIWMFLRMGVFSGDFMLEEG